MPNGLKTKKWEERMEQTKREAAIKKLEKEMKEEKLAEAAQRRETIRQRKLAAEEKQRIEEAKALVGSLMFTFIWSVHPLTSGFKMGARKAARLRRKAGRTKKINH